jgi:predicted nucleic acid-binding protein
LIVLDASAVVDLLLRRSNAPAIQDDLARGGGIRVPAHFEADAYAGLRRMVFTGLTTREEIAPAVSALADLAAERMPLAPILPAAFGLFDRLGAHDAFYVVVAMTSECPLVTSDGALARAALDLGIEVRYHASR